MTRCRSMVTAVLVLAACSAPITGRLCAQNDHGPNPHPSSLTPHLSLDPSLWLAFDTDGRIDVTDQGIHLLSQSHQLGGFGPFVVSRDMYEDREFTAIVELMRPRAEIDGGEINFLFANPAGQAYWYVQFGDGGTNLLTRHGGGWDVRASGPGLVPDEWYRVVVHNRPGACDVEIFRGIVGRGPDFGELSRAVPRRLPELEDGGPQVAALQRAENGELFWKATDVPHDTGGAGPIRLAAYATWATVGNGLYVRRLEIPPGDTRIVDHAFEYARAMYPSRVGDLKPLEEVVKAAEARAGLAERLEKYWYDGEGVRETDTGGHGGRPLRTREEASSSPTDRRPASGIGHLASDAETSVQEDEDGWTFLGPQLSMRVRREDGAISELVSHEPEPLSLLPEGRRATALYAVNLDEGWSGLFDRFSDPNLDRGEDEDGTFWRLSGMLTSSERRLARIMEVRLTYRFYPDHLRIAAQVNYKSDDPSTFELGFLQRCRQDQWDRHFYPATVGSHFYYHMGVEAKHRYQDAANDTTTLSVYQMTGRPYGVLERADRRLLWGFTDLGLYTVLRGLYMGAAPAFTVQPRGIRAGDSYAFDFVVKVFPKPAQSLVHRSFSEGGYMDVCQWYLQHLTSSNPLTRGIVRLPKNVKPHILGDGNFSFGVFAESGTPKDYYDPEYYRTWEETAHRIDAVHLWFSHYYPWNDLYATEGGWTTWFGYQMTAEGLKRDVDHLQREEGFRLYFYFRQLWRNPAWTDEGPLKKAWLFKDKWGDTRSFANLWYRLDPLQKKLFGVQGDELIGELYGNFLNDEFRNWYIDQVKRYVETFHPLGIGWDMGWYDLGMGYCSADPPGPGIQHGILRVQYEIYKWLKENHPEVKVITNGDAGNVSGLYADGVMFESPSWGIYPEDMEAAMPFRNSIINLSYPDTYQGIFGQNWQERHVQLLMKCLAQGASWGGRSYDMFEHKTKVEEWPLTSFFRMDTGMHLNYIRTFARFSALTNGTPRVIETGAVQVEPSDDMCASAWAQADRLLACAYNDSGAPQDLRIRIDRSVLAQYGLGGQPRVRLTRLNSNCKPVPFEGWTAEWEPDGLVISARLEGHEMALAEGEGG